VLTTIASLMCAVTLGWIYRSQHTATREARSRLLDTCAGLLEKPRRSQSAAGFARLQGACEGYAVSMVLEEDHAAMRKIPSLWLHVSVVGGSEPATGTIDILSRPRNTEFFSPSWDWDGRVAALPGWPEDAVYRTADNAPDLQAIDLDVKQLFADERMKELLVTPQGVRLTYQAKQAQRSEYLLLRSVVFDEEPLPVRQVEDLLRQALQIRKNVEAAGAVCA